MTRRFRHSPADCDVGDFFPCPVEAGSYLLWCFLPPIPCCGIPPDPDWTRPTWIFRRAAWRSDSGPYILDVFVRKA